MSLLRRPAAVLGAVAPSPPPAASGRGIVSWGHAQVCSARSRHSSRSGARRSLAWSASRISPAPVTCAVAAAVRATLEQGYIPAPGEQVAVLAPRPAPRGLFNTQPDSAERSRAPICSEGALGVARTEIPARSLSPATWAGSLGRHAVQSRAVTADARVKVGPVGALGRRSAEGARGIGREADPVRTSGRRQEVRTKALGSAQRPAQGRSDDRRGCGLDDPEDGDLSDALATRTAGSRTRVRGTRGLPPAGPWCSGSSSGGSRPRTRAGNSRPNHVQPGRGVSI